MGTDYLDTIIYLKFLRFLFRFTGKDDEINLLGDGTEKPEFGEWAWLSPEEVLDRVGSTSPKTFYMNLVMKELVILILLLLYIFSAGGGVQEISLQGSFDSFLPSSQLKLIKLIYEEGLRCPSTDLLISFLSSDLSNFSVFHVL